MSSGRTAAKQVFFKGLSTPVKLLKLLFRCAAYTVGSNGGPSVCLGIYSRVRQQPFVQDRYNESGRWESKINRSVKGRLVKISKHATVEQVNKNETNLKAS